MMNLKEKLQKYIDKYLEKSLKPKRLPSDICCSVIVLSYPECKEELLVQESKIGDSPIDIFITENEDLNKFQTVLFRMIEERKLNDSEVYNKVHIDRRLFSKIRSDKNYHPSKDTVILLGLSLELKVGELEELLDSAAYSLPKNNHYDLIIRFCFLNKIFDVNKVNDLLFDYKCKPFNY